MSTRLMIHTATIAAFAMALVVKANDLPAAATDATKAANAKLLSELPFDGPKAAGSTILLNWDFTDTGEKVLVSMENGVLNHTIGAQDRSADATITLTRSTLNNVLLNETTLAKEIAAGNVKVTGNRAKLDQLLSLLDSFEFWFNIVTP